MEIKVGMVVRSIAGHDKGDLMIVVGVDGEYAYVSDGKLRKVSKPKKKKFKHLQGSYDIYEGDLSQDYMVRKALTKYRN